MCLRLALFALILTGLTGLAWSDGPKDNLPDNVRRIPPPGIKISDAERAELQQGVDDLGKEIDTLRSAFKQKAPQLELLPDVQIFYNAVRYALTYDEFFNAKEMAVARTLLKTGFDRARQLRDGKPSWTTQTGPIARGYVSKIDGSVQPYGVFVPKSYQPDTAHRFRLDFWCHGRGETLSELSFINGTMNSGGPFTPPNAIVVQLYGRYCNANRFAGEVDLFEAYERVRKQYPIDENRLVIRGFSMGGASCWQFATHHPGMWAAAAPGAGFSETKEFLNFFQGETLKPSWYEEKLWHMYDCTDYAVNLYNCPTVAYSGEIDKQKQAADVMARELLKVGLTLSHIIGPKTAHAYHPEAKAELNRRIDSIVDKGRNSAPDRIKFTTWTVRYNKCQWLEVDGLERHWERATVEAVIQPRGTDPARFGNDSVTLHTSNVSALTLSFSPGYCPLDKAALKIDDDLVHELPPVLTDRSWTVHVRMVDGKWKVVPKTDDGTLVKRHGLQGPIDDAFLDRFIMVKPTGQALNDKIGKWASTEMAHAIEHWRRQFRGEALVKDDSAITSADIAASNLVLWGDPMSNKILARIADKLPIRWEGNEILVGNKKFSSDHHVPVLIFPNPLNPKKYVVLNSGFTFREYDYLNNARQVPRLPDFAVVDVNQPVTSRAPGGIVDAGFFDEHWQVSSQRP
jgi:dienelactone hydrolase